jgi:hypothetical protein
VFALSSSASWRSDGVRGPTTRRAAGDVTPRDRTTARDGGPCSRGTVHVGAGGRGTGADLPDGMRVRRRGAGVGQARVGRCDDPAVCRRGEPGVVVDVILRGGGSSAGDGVHRPTSSTTDHRGDRQRQVHRSTGDRQRGRRCTGTECADLSEPDGDDLVVEGDAQPMRPGVLTGDRDGPHAVGAAGAGEVSLGVVEGFHGVRRATEVDRRGDPLERCAVGVGDGDGDLHVDAGSPACRQVGGSRVEDVAHVAPPPAMRKASAMDAPPRNPSAAAVRLRAVRVTSRPATSGRRSAGRPRRSR